MIDGRIQVIDLNPLQYSRFSRVFDRLSSVQPQLVLWHEESIPRRQLVDGRAEPIGAFRIDDARVSARELFDSYRGKLRRVVVTDLDGYDRLYAAHNLNPEPDEDKYQYLDRMNRAVCAEFDQKVAIYPEPTLDRGPVSYRRIRSFVEQLQPDPCCLILAVFDGQSLFFSFVAGVSRGKVDLVTSFGHWGKALENVRFTGLELDRIIQLIGEQFRPVAGALFVSSLDFDKLFNGESHEGRPESLALGTMAFGYSVDPDSLRQTLLDTAGLFAYVPVRIP